MFRFPGAQGKDLCDSHLGNNRRDFLRVGGAGMLGMTLNTILRAQSASANSPLAGSSGWGKAKSVIMLYLQGGPSHLDLWDPKEPNSVPDNVRSDFSNIQTKLPGVNFTEILPGLAQVNDKFTMIRSMSYTPVGLFNHTAAIYQIMTGYTTDKVGPSGQLEPPTPKDFPNFGSNIVRLKPTDEPMLPFVMLPRPLQESNVVNKGGTAGFLGKAFDPYYLFPEGDDMNMAKMDNVKVDDLQLRPDVFSVRLNRRASLREAISAKLPLIDKAVADYNIDDYTMITEENELYTPAMRDDFFDMLLTKGYSYKDHTYLGGLTHLKKLVDHKNLHAALEWAPVLKYNELAKKPSLKNRDTVFSLRTYT